VLPTFAGIERGYTLVELIVALLLFAVGGLALASTSAILGKGLNIDAARESAARIASTEIEMLTAGCHSASNGGRTYSQIRSDWTVTRQNPNTIEIRESVSYPGPGGRRTDSYRALVGCR
jgi:prepilin-type N-terminal cleavage/methylation domain-containing protein